MPNFLLPLFLVFFVTACATSPTGRSQLVAPSALQGFSAVYSELDMRLQLVTAEDAPSCASVDCVEDRAFDQQVLVLGTRLSDAAYRLYPDLISRFPRFEFIVADKAEAGSASSAGGMVVVFRGIRHLKPDDATLAFVLAREMSHVIAGHHDENVTTSVLVAIATQLLFPALNLVRGGAAAVSSSAATTVASSTLTTTAVTSVASFAGARVLRASDRPQQVQEAKVMAKSLLAAAGWNGRELTDPLETLPPAAPDKTERAEEPRESSVRVASAGQGPAQAVEPSSEPVVQMATLLSELPPALVSRPF